MSDRFNSNEAKEKISSLLSLKASEFTREQGRPIEEAFPEFFQFPKIKLTSSELSSLLKQHNITTYKPSTIPTLEKMDVIGMINPDIDELLNLDDGQALLPVGDTEFIPRYTPKYSATNYDLKLYKQLIFQYLEDQNSELFAQSVGDMLKVPEQYVFSTGTPQGQISRMEQMNIIHNGLNGKRKPKSCIELLTKEMVNQAGSPMEAACSVLEYYLPLNKPTEFMDGGWPGLFNRPSYFVSLNPDDSYDYLPKIGKDKIAGLPYVGDTKGKRLIEALVLADNLMAQTNDVIRSASPEANIQIQGLKSPLTDQPAAKKMKELFENNWYLGCGQLFPKMERYEIDSIYKKTRNIFAMPFPTHILSSLISNPVTEKSPNFMSADTPSLAKFSPFHGNLDYLLQKVVFESTESTSLIYADNWYIIFKEEDGSKTWFSLDQEKAESQAQFDDFRLLSYYLLTRGHVVNGQPAFNLTWMAMAMIVIPVLISDPTVLLSNIQFVFPGMGSGVSWTFLINHIRSSMIDAKWRRVGKPRPGSKEFTDKVLEPCGCNLKIEYEALKIDEQLTNLKRDTPDDGYVSNNAQERASLNPTPYVKLDLLGWGAAYSRAIDKYIPVLEEERLKLSVMLPTKDESHDYKDKPWQRHSYEVARLEALRLVGGWRIAPLDRALKNNAQDARTKLLRMKKLTREELQDAFNRTEFGAELDASEINLVRPVEFDDLIILNSPKPESKIDYKRPIKWNVDMMSSIPRSQNIPGVSVLAQSKIDQWFEKRSLAKQDISHAQLDEFVHSKVYTEAVMELQSFKNLIRKRPEQYQFRPAITKPEKASNPVVSFGISSKDKNIGTFKNKTGFGPSRPLKPVPAREQANLENLNKPLVPGQNPMPAPKLTVVKEKPKTPQQLQQQAQQRQPPFKPMGYKELMKLSPDMIANYLVRHYSTYGGYSVIFKNIHKALSEGQWDAVQNEIEAKHGEAWLDKIAEAISQ